MSSIVLSGDTSGTVTVAVPAVAGTNTVTIAAQTGTLNAAGPAFSAYAGTTTSIANATSTKVTFNTEEFDTNNNFASSRFTPTVAGYYQINACVYTSATTGALELIIYKSGASYKAGSFIPSITAVGAVSAVSSIVYCNGSTDYIEIYAYQTSGITTTAQALQDYTYFNGCLVRGA